MNAAEARSHALGLLRARLAKGVTQDHIMTIVFEGHHPVHAPGYLIQTGRITVPAFGPHTFRLADLFREIAAPQRDLFA